MDEWVGFNSFGAGRETVSEEVVFEWKPEFWEVQVLENIQGRALQVQMIAIANIVTHENKGMHLMC